MINRTFAILDTVVGAYMAPWLAPNIPAGVRIFSDACLGENTQMKAHPMDFVLMELGAFDDQTGIFESNPEGPKRIASAYDVLPKEVTNPSDMFTRDLRNTGLESDTDDQADLNNANPGGTD